MARNDGPVRRRIGQVSYYQHHGSWYIYHRQGGKPVRRRVDGGEAQAEYDASILNAQLVAAAANLAASASSTTTPGVAGSPAAIAIADLRRRFLEHHEYVLNSSMATVDRYRTATLYLERFVQSCGCGSLDLDVARFVQHLRTIEVAPNGHAKAARRTLRDKGISYILETSRSLYHFGARQGLFPKDHANPFTRFGLAQLRIRDAKPVFVFAADQELDFLKAATPWAFAVHLTLAKTGIRPGELAHLLIEDVDLEQGLLTVRGKPDLGWSVKTGRERRVPLIAEVVALLRQLIGGRAGGPVFLRERFDVRAEGALRGGRTDLAVAAGNRLALLRLKSGHPPTRTEQASVYRTVWRDAGAVDADRIRNSFIRANRRVGLSATCPKSWRHTFATLLQQANVDVLVRQETLGHKPAAPEMSALGMTGVYTHTTPEFQRAEIERALRLRPRSLELVSTFLTKQGRESEATHVAR